jgi:hypothetical protein
MDCKAVATDDEGTEVWSEDFHFDVFFFVIFLTKTGNSICEEIFFEIDPKTQDGVRSRVGY